MKTIAERVTEYVTKRSPDAICDKCIAEALDIRRSQANRVAGPIALTRDYERDLAECKDCGETKKVVRRI